MVYRCVKCGKMNYSHPHLTFRRFPDKVARRQRWISILGLENVQIIKHAHLCSDHFDPSDIMTIGINCKKQIRPDAEPKFDTSVFEDVSSNSSESTIFPSPSRKSSRSSSADSEPKLGETNLLPNLPITDCLKSDPDIAGSSSGGVEPPMKRLCSSLEQHDAHFSIVKEEVLEESSGSTTETASEVEEIVENWPEQQSTLSTISSAETEVKNQTDIDIKKRLCSSPEQHTAHFSILKEEVLEESSESTTETASEVEEIVENWPEQQSTLSTVSSAETAEVKNQTDTKKRKRYMGDSSSSDFSTSEKRKKSLAFVKNFDKKRRVKIHSLQMTVRELKLRITSFKQLIDHLKEKSLISESSESTIKASLSGPAQDIFSRILKGPACQKYNPSLRSFALTLAFYSPKAYNFVRNTFNRSLPHLRTITRWYRSIDGSPGFIQESLNALMLRQKSSSRPLLCNLVLGEMSIRKQVEWTGTKVTGYVDLGTNIDSDTLPEAREVLVFMLVGINGAWKIPVGYFLIDGLSATEKAELVKKCLKFVHESGVIVTSLTFDGAAANLSIYEKLGADFSDHLNLKTQFNHPVTKQPIFIYLDPRHMLKLIRNCLASQAELVNGEKQVIKWDFITKLVERQNLEGLHAATKLRKRLVKEQREKMSIALATQTISKSVSNALTFLREDLKCLDFEGSEATSSFLLLFNNLFDIFNSRNIFSKYSFKKPLSKVNSSSTFDFFERAKVYIISLTLKDRPVLSSPRKTGFLGFLICMKSLQDMYNYYVTEKQLSKYILTYKLSQNHLELFFRAMRIEGGFDNNPTARQFEASYKRLLVHSEIRAHNTANALDSIPVLMYGSEPEIIESSENSRDYLNYMQSVEADIENNYLMSNAWDLTIYVEDIVSYISGFVVKGLKKLITCEKCLLSLEDHIVRSLLQRRKNVGKLAVASKFVTDICKAAEKFFRFFDSTKGIFNKANRNLMQILVTSTFNNLPASMFHSCGEHMYDDEILSEHPFYISKLILKSYFRIRIHYETIKKLELSRKNKSRNINTKIIISYLEMNKHVVKF